MRRVSLALAIGIAVFALFPRFVAATPDHPVNAFPTIFSDPRVDVLPDGKVVINVNTMGEFKGILTFNLAPEDGAIRGDWALVVRYTDNTDPATGLEPPNHDHETAEQHEVASATGDADHPHLDFVRYVHDGGLSGTIDAAALDFDSHGNLIDFRAQLTITLGTAKFDGATGNGLAELTRGLSLVVNGGQR